MRRILLVILAALLAPLATTAPAAAARMLGDPTVPFTADRMLTIGDRSYAGKIYATPGAQRHEQMIAGIQQVIILHGDQAKGWLVLPAVNSYVEFGFAPAAIELSDATLLSTRLGEETIGGLRTSKYRVEHTARDGTMVDGYLWLTREGIPMRMDGAYTPPNGGKITPFHMELSNVRQGRQDQGLFVVPQNMVRLPTGALGALLGAKAG